MIFAVVRKFAYNGKCIYEEVIMIKTDCDHTSVKVSTKGSFRELRVEMLVTCSALLKVYKKALRKEGLSEGQVNNRLDAFVNTIWDQAIYDRAELSDANDSDEPAAPTEE